jgi:Family of unknown function (DUF6496)
MPELFHFLFLSGSDPDTARQSRFSAGGTETGCWRSSFRTLRAVCAARRFQEAEMARKYSKSASKDVESAMRRRKKGKLKSGKGGKGGKVESRKQAIAIGLSEARKKGKKVPKKKKR